MRLEEAREELEVGRLVGRVTVEVAGVEQCRTGLDRGANQLKRLGVGSLSRRPGAIERATVSSWSPLTQLAP